MPLYDRGRDDAWRDGYDEWKLRSPEDDRDRYGSMYDDDEDDGHIEPDFCEECDAMVSHGQPHDETCSHSGPMWRVRLWRAWHFHVAHWRVWPFPSVRQVQAWWFLRNNRKRKSVPQPRVPDDDIPF